MSVDLIPAKIVIDLLGMKILLLLHVEGPQSLSSGP
jgi:hypothetical protein